MEDRADRRALGDRSEVHHCDIIGDVGDHTQVVGDEHDRHAGFVPELAQQFKDLCLRRHVQGGGGLVGDQ
ncbi:hypothetical protein HEB94_005518 [Actinopolymorpha pittospori]|uniref:Uncharacterized protein n=1 Tax=Actinopolymorpha pittospori TaxID=648752 RepID=A0A927RDZ9_9ACTN|nr:hypothetical protein [Actinopolymorpha pittospori]